jgi:hypothetical protein
LTTGKEDTVRRESRHVLAGVVLGLVLGGVSAIGYSQARQPQPVAPKTFSGEELGFRMTARKGETPVGQLVVRVDGEWREVEFSSGMKLITR